MSRLSEMAKALGKAGGKKSVKIRFKGKTKREISDTMRMVRYSKKQHDEMNARGKEFVASLNQSVLDEQNH